MKGLFCGVLQLFQYRILPGNGSGVEKKTLASLPLDRQMDLYNSTFSPSAIPYHQPLLATELGEYS